jgi:hypothetical protein
VLDGTGVNGRHSDFYAALSNVRFTVPVTDAETGMPRVYENAGGSFASRADTNAF